MIRCGVYLRQSEDDDDDRLAVSRQWDEIIDKICTPRGWEPVRYCDNDRTAVGKKRKLPDRDRMLKDAESGHIQAIAALDLDRLYREPIDLEHIIPLADEKGILLATVTGDVDLSTDNGRLFARIKGAVAKAETERKSARQKLKTKQMAESGQNWGSRRPFGYHLGGEIHPIEAPELRNAYQLVLNGHSLYSIIADWNERGILTTLGNRWRNSNQLTVVLKNPRNAGLKSHRPRSADGRTGELKILGEAPWSRIVTRDVWQAVNDILADPSRRPKDMGRKHLLSTFALCGECTNDREKITLKAAKSSPPASVLIYRCRQCFRVVYPMDVVDEHITDLVVEVLSRPDAAELLVDQRQPDLDSKRAEAKALRARLVSLAVNFADGELDDDQLRVATARIKAKLNAVDQVMEDANRARLFKGLVGEDAARFRDAPLERRRAVIKALMTVTLRRGSSIRDPFDPDRAVIIEWHRLGSGPDVS